MIPKTSVISVYFGELPSYFQLWLDSCGNNTFFDWNVFTDAPTGTYRTPRNVKYSRLTLEGFGEIVSKYLRFDIKITSPYKVCDFRPLFHILLDPNERYEFWGHCDIDMIFGDMDKFLTPDLFRNYDKIFGVGHLTLYRNDEKTNSFFQRPHPNLDWREIVSRSEHYGFDEHIGVNRIWKLHNGRFFENESIIADIDPGITRFERASTFERIHNYRHQVFWVDRGAVKRLYECAGRIQEESFMYIHFQKRKLPPPTFLPDTGRYYITPGGFVAMSDSPLDRREMDQLNGSPRLTWSELGYRLRRFARLARRSLNSGDTNP